MVESSPFAKLIQVGIVVKDLDQAVEHFSSLGFGPFQPLHKPENAEEYFRGKPMKAEMKICAAKMGPVDLELIQPVSGKSPHQEFLDRNGEGIQHIAFAVDDLKKEVARLTEKGATVLLDAKLTDVNVAYLDLGCGLVVELIQKNKSPKIQNKK
jgi:methylmalonyl-CoA/ethylmalonyl-CoA epimerase